MGIFKKQRKNTAKMGALFTNDFHQNPLAAKSIELAIKNLLPGPEVELPIAHSHHDLASHDHSLEMSVGIVLSAIVSVLRVRVLGGQFFQPLFKVAVEPLFVVVNEHAGRNVHGIDETQTFPDSAFFETPDDFRRDVEKRTATGHLKP
jgi:hypothetical protein